MNALVEGIQSIQKAAASAASQAKGATEVNLGAADQATDAQAVAQPPANQIHDVDFHANVQAVSGVEMPQVAAHPPHVNNPIASQIMDQMESFSSGMGRIKVPNFSMSRLPPPPADGNIGSLMTYMQQASEQSMKANSDFSMGMLKATQDMQNAHIEEEMVMNTTQSFAENGKKLTNGGG